MICHRSTLPVEARELVAHVLQPERRCIDAEHPTLDGDGRVGVGRHELGLAELFLADARRVHELLVSEVHEVVEHELVVALGVDRHAVARPSGVGHLLHVGDAGGVGEGRIAEPDPHIAVAVDDGERGHHRARVEGLLGGHPGAAPGGVVAKAVVGALDVLRAHRLAHRQGCKAVPARVRERYRAAVLRAVEREGSARNRARERLARDLVVPRGDIPGVAWVVENLRSGGLHHLTPSSLTIYEYR